MKDKIVLNGGQRLEGEIPISGSKNSALPILAATLLGQGDQHLTNVPALGDVETMVRLLRHLGVRLTYEAGGLTVNASTLTGHDAPEEMVKTMRASVLVLGPLLSRLGEARVPLPGGCAIGARPIQLHLMGLEQMGCEILIKCSMIHIRSRQHRLQGARIRLDHPTVTGTENLMMAATLAEGTTVIHQAAREPEVVDLARFLKARGGRIHGEGTDVLTIEGVSSLRPAAYNIMPDRIEAGTYAIAGAITQGDLMISPCNPEQLDPVVGKLRSAGLDIREEDHGIRVRARRRVESVDIRTLPYPEFPTDMQAQMMALMSLGTGCSTMTETIFENRFNHVPELHRMGADIVVNGPAAVVRGVRRLRGAPVMAADLRGSACLVLAGLAAEGKTTVHRIDHLDRGYESIELKLQKVGAHIERIRGET